MIIRETDVKGLGIVALSDGSLFGNLRELNGRIISIRDEAYARINGDIGRHSGTRVAIAFDYVAGDVPVASKYRQLELSLVGKVVRANSQGKYFRTDSMERYDLKRETADKEKKSGVPFEKRTAIALPREKFWMSPLDHSDYFAFFFEDMAASYFEHNKDTPIDFSHLDKNIVDGNQDQYLLLSPHGTIVVPYGWFYGLDFCSEIDGECRFAHRGDSLEHDGGADGILKSD